MRSYTVYYIKNYLISRKTYIFFYNIYKNQALFLYQTPSPRRNFSYVSRGKPTLPLAREGGVQTENN